MSPAERSTLLLIFALAVLAPILADWIPRVRLPVVVLELGLGILIGPYVLGWAQPGPVLGALSRFGMATLFFLAGLEIDFHAIRGRPLRAASVGWLLSFGVAIAIGMMLQGLGIAESGLLLGGALTTTALGTLIPILRDAHELDTRFGKFVVAAGALGEFGPIVLISAALSGGAEGGDSGSRATSVLLLLAFCAIAVGAAYLAARALPDIVVDLLVKKLHTSAQLPVRVAILLLAGLVLLTMQFGLDAVLGALAAGIVVGLACKGHAGETVRLKLEGLGFGFFVPIFFFVSGTRFNVQALGHPATLARLSLFLVLFLVVRGLPVLLCRRDLPRRDLVSMALLSATALPLVIAVAEIGLETNRLSNENATALVGAGLGSVLLFPALALSLRRPAPSPAPGGARQTTFGSASEQPSRTETAHA